MPSLYEAGWRQGSIVAATLPFDAVVVDPAGQVIRQQGEHERWVVATQECDLNLTEPDDAQPTIELRAVHADDPPQDWGLRSSRFRLTESDYVLSQDPRVSVSAAALTALIAAGAQRLDPTEARSRAFAIWLGLRYDRPALPPELVPLARRIAEEVRRRQGRVVAARVRDVLMLFDEDPEPIRYSLFAILEEASDEVLVREWLAGIASRVPPEMGIGDQFEAVTAERISLQLLEQSYAADVTQLTWRPSEPEPTGAD
jgi:hypothetical protein